MIKQTFVMKNFDVIVLAAGKGTRMGSTKKPKILLEITNKSILSLVVDLLESCNFKSANFVIGYKSQSIAKSLKKLDFKSNIVIQHTLNGTAKALEAGLEAIKDNTKHVLVLYGDDSGLYRPKSIKDFIKHHISNDNIATFMVLKDNRMSDIGGLEVNKDMEVIGVRTMDEIKANPKSNHYILCGAFCFNVTWIKNNISKIKVNPVSEEYPLPKILEVAKRQGKVIKGFLLKDKLEWESVNTKEELKKANLKKINK